MKLKYSKLSNKVIQIILTQRTLMPRRGIYFASKEPTFNSLISNFNFAKADLSFVSNLTVPCEKIVRFKYI